MLGMFVDLLGMGGGVEVIVEVIVWGGIVGDGCVFLLDG